MMDGRSRVHSSRYCCGICAVTPPTVPVRSSTGQLFCLLCVQGSVLPQGQAQPILAPIPQRLNPPPITTPRRILINQSLRGCMRPINAVDEPFTAQVMREVLDRLQNLGVLSAALELAYDDERKSLDWGFMTHVELLLRAIWSE